MAFLITNVTYPRQIPCLTSSITASSHSRSHLDPIYIPSTLGSDTIAWNHSLALAGYSGTCRTLFILEYIVCLHGYPKDVISDRGPQFTDRFWKAFCHQIDTTCRLSFGYHSGPTNWGTTLGASSLTISTPGPGTRPFKVCHRFQPPIFCHQELDTPSVQQLDSAELWSLEHRASNEPTNATRSNIITSILLDDWAPPRSSTSTPNPGSS